MDDIIKVKHRGSFHVGGEKVKLENAPVEDFPYQGKFTFHSDPNGTHWAKQMYVQYTELAEPVCPYPILMWHGGGLTGVTWETTPDGREGFDTLFLRHGFNVYVSDAVERGRASWAKFPEINPTPPIFHSYESRWLNLKMGETYPIPYEGNRFPIGSPPTSGPSTPTASTSSVCSSMWTASSSWFIARVRCIPKRSCRSTPTS